MAIGSGIITSFIFAALFQNVWLKSSTEQYVVHMEPQHAERFREAIKKHPVKIEHLARGHIFKLTAQKDNSSWQEELATLEGVAALSSDEEKIVDLRQATFISPDPLNIPYWSLPGLSQIYDAHVEHNILGRDVNICVLDDGVDPTIPEFAGRFRPELSFDYVNGVANPDHDFPQMHGTHVASVALGGKFNGYCSYGAAPKASMSAARIISKRGTVSPSRQVLAFLGDANGKSRDRQTDIFVASWGATDDGINIDSPDRNAKMALLIAARDGRRGKGALIFFAAGNGGQKDDCACDGYASNAYAVAVQPVNFNGSVPAFAEHCAAAMTSAYVDSGLAASNPRWAPNQCTTSFSGTSAATPSVGGTVALALEANPRLTRRDVLHLIVRSSRTEGLGEGVDWITNAANHKFSPFFGFGVLNAIDLIKNARSWPEHHPGNAPFCNISATNADPFLRTKTFDANQCRNIVRVEYIVLRTTIIAPTTRGNVELYMTSPSGTRVRLLRRRPLDSNTEFKNWEFLTPAFWDESPQGEWRLDFTTEPHGPLLNFGGDLEIYGVPREYPTTTSTTTTTTTAEPEDDRNWFEKKWDQVKDRLSEWFG